jgi:hypothetical protein
MRKFGQTAPGCGQQIKSDLGDQQRSDEPSSRSVANVCGVATCCNLTEVDGSRDVKLEFRLGSQHTAAKRGVMCVLGHACNYSVS